MKHHESVYFWVTSGEKMYGIYLHYAKVLVKKFHRIKCNGTGGSVCKGWIPFYDSFDKVNLWIKIPNIKILIEIKGAHLQTNIQQSLKC